MKGAKPFAGKESPEEERLEMNEVMKAHKDEGRKGGKKSDRKMPPRKGGR